MDPGAYAGVAVAEAHEVGVAAVAEEADREVEAVDAKNCFFCSLLYSTITEFLTKEEIVYYFSFCDLMFKYTKYSKGTLENNRILIAFLTACMNLVVLYKVIGIPRNSRSSLFEILAIRDPRNSRSSQFEIFAIRDPCNSFEILAIRQ